MVEYEEAEIKVFWDIENCPLPRGFIAERTAQKLTLALRKKNLRGPISISAYGNLNHIPPSVKQALSSTGIVLEHVHSRKLSMHMFQKVLDWRLKVATPANVMVICRDSSSTILHGMRKSKRFNILMAHPPNPSLDEHGPFVNTTWIWRSLLEEQGI